MLTIQQPWGWAFFHAGKGVENRDWRISIAPGTRLGIQSSARVGRAEYAASAAAIRRITGKLPPTLDELRAAGQLGALLGAVTVVGWVEQSRSPWFVGPHGLVVREPLRLARPWAMRGQQRLFKRAVPAEVARELELVGAEPQPEALR